MAIFLGFLALKAVAATYYVDVNSTTPTPPYTNWAAASTDIQSAIDISTNGDLILVNPGIYQTGGRTVNGYALTNRVVIDQAVTVESVSGPATTIIEGYQVPGTTNGNSAVRCVYMTNNAVLIGFTLTNGATRLNNSDENHEASGGGVWCEDNSAIVSNCVLSANTADFTFGVGGGIFKGTLNNCILIGNLSVGGGGAYESMLSNCTLTDNSSFQSLNSQGLGGGAFSCTLNQCVLAGNIAGAGGGAWNSVMNGCTVTNNTANGNGGGADGSTLNNCMISGNSAGDGGGTYGSSLTNCSLIGNSAPYGGASDSDTLDSCILSSNYASSLGGATLSSILTNCTVMNNSAGTGGGAAGGTLNNCILFGNISFSTGGGVNSATINNSALFGNFAVQYGGGAAGSTLNNCTLTGNSADSGGGVYSSSLTNCIVYYNEAENGANYDAGSSLAYSCTTPLPANGSGNIVDAPDLADNFHLAADSPCSGAGNPAYVTGVDIDGYPWMNPPAIGCDDVDPGAATGPLTVAIQATFTNLATGYAGSFAAQINGHAAISVWDFGDGIEVTNQPDVSHIWTTSGVYQVSLWVYNESNPDGVSATITVQVTNEPVQYVALGNTTPAAPYLSWATAATNIQDAVDAAFGDGIILVSNGVYQTGGRVGIGTVTNRVTISRPITVESVNGPAVTTIQGYLAGYHGLGNNIGSAIRCVSLADGASLIGFTLTNGATEPYSPVDEGGGGVCCQSTNAFISNCVITVNSSFGNGAGVYSGTIEDCQFINNTNVGFENGGGAAYSILLNCTLLGNSIYSGSSHVGGGALYCSLSNCVIAGNSSDGVAYCTLQNCTIENNTGGNGGGAYQSTLNNCLLIGNQGSSGGGAYDCMLNFCLISNNVANFVGGGADYDSQQTNALGQSNVVVGNMAKNGNGGGVALGINLNLAGWSFISNSAAGNAAAGTGSGGGFSGEASISNCTFVGNFASVNGGGCYNPSTATPVFDCNFIGNTAVGSGGGAYADLTNCLVVGNKAGSGGGVYGIVNNCIINSNVATTNGGGLYAAYFMASTVGMLTGCTFTNNSALNGGGVYVNNNLPLNFSNCAFWANSATSSGGGIEFLNAYSLINCIIENNEAGTNGGGVDNAGFIVNCLLTGNSAPFGGADYVNNSTLTILDSTVASNRAADNGGGIYWSPNFIPSWAVTNSIIYGNSAPTNMNYSPTNSLNSSRNSAGANYCCTLPLPLPASGASNSNFTNNPAFVNPAGGDFHLQSSSPCINSGNNAAVAGNTDLDGNPRIVGGTVDMGAYEYQTPVSMTSYHWLQQYGLPINANTDTSHPNGTSFDVYQDWIAGLNPTNPASVLVMLPLLPNNNASGITVSWESVTNFTYDLQRATNLTSAFTTIQANIRALAGTTSYQDGSATNSGPYFYRVAVP